MDLIDGLQSSPGLLAGACGVLGLIVGSFLNVVILRLPRMMEIAWRREAREILGQPAEPEERLSLLHPASRCPACGTGIKPWHNVPVLGWLWLRGRCARCRAPISLQYPLVEAASGALAVLCAIEFGWSLQLVSALLFTWMLLALAIIDLRTQLLPDDLTLPLLWLGLGLSLVPVFASPTSAIVGAMAGYLSLWAVFHLFRLVTGKEGMGYGDFKLLAAIGAWLGWQALPMVILLSSLVGAMVGIGMILLLGHDRRVPIPFGPYLAAAGWLALMYGDSLLGLYARTAGLS
ncbi:leader peptidase (prepilin peptidase) / N-methyltransferase [Fontimonas thermophila]|uniref:Prepilin leader peptidase/N-methyltransferase n=1 Tax=Fontimonas thermophila TaxID=1076937 RepID=A0A1I2K3E4_9GAMM|nr:A24 family peptidase [Fontimonas thermophila]SFF60858.1 leader peptidase (prepilin peptidase) / N-methyltransferase [Fontimonas thermophila]